MRISGARLFVKPDCPLCDEARLVLAEVTRRLPLQVQEVDIEGDAVWRQLYAEHVPVLDLGDHHRLYWPFTPDQVLAELQTAPATAYPRPLAGWARRLLLGLDGLIYWFSKHWLSISASVLGLFVALPLLAPILMAAGLVTPANLIYAAYSLVCHQLPSRSFFIFGQQMAFCQRDLAIYASLLVGMLAFGLVRRRLRPLPVRFYLLMILPMAIDGITQTVGLRLSTWQLRVVTGVLFGTANAWLALPYLEDIWRDVQRSAERQLADDRRQIGSAGDAAPDRARTMSGGGLARGRSHH